MAGNARLPVGWEMAETAAPWVADILDFWFGLEPEQWWSADPALDEEVRTRFLPLWEQQLARPADRFLDSPALALAAVILFDQVPRNMFRGDARAFSTDALARSIADRAIARGCDDALDAGQRLFLYLPSEHSENLADQHRSVALIGQLGDRQALDYAERHLSIITRFGRFPSRNAALGRVPTLAELAAGEPAADR